MNNHLIKAFLLSAGLGSRLRPLTDVTPKCLVDVGNQPVLGRWLTSLAHINCSSALINTHYLHQQVEEYLDSTCHMYDFEISSTYESDLLGTAGSLIKNIDFLIAMSVYLCMLIIGWQRTSLILFQLINLVQVIACWLCLHFIPINPIVVAS